MSLPSSGPSVREENEFSSRDLQCGESMADQGALGGWGDRSPVCLEPAIRPSGETTRLLQGSLRVASMPRGRGRAHEASDRGGTSRTH